MSNSQLKKRVMRRVYGVWFIRKATPLAAETGGLCGLGIWGLQYISPVHIVENAFQASNSNLPAFLVFFQRAFFHLSQPSQFALVVTAILGVIIVRDVWTQAKRLFSARQHMFLPV